MEKAEEAVRNEKSLNRYREEQGLGETDMSLAGFVRTIFNRQQAQRKPSLSLSRRSFFIVQICLPNVV